MRVLPPGTKFMVSLMWLIAGRMQAVLPTVPVSDCQ